MTNTSNDPIISRLEALRQYHAGGAQHDRIEARLLAEFPEMAARTRGMRGVMNRHRTMLALIGVLLGGGAIAATAAMLRAKLYTFTVTDQEGQVLARPRVLVAEGQMASIQIVDPETGESALDVSIDGEGNVSVAQDDLTIEADVVEIELPDGRATPQAMFGDGTKYLVRFIAADGLEISTAAVIVHPELGGAAELTGYGTGPITVRIAADGSVDCDGCGDVSVVVEPVE